MRGYMGGGGTAQGGVSGFQQRQGSREEFGYFLSSYGCSKNLFSAVQFLQ